MTDGVQHTKASPPVVQAEMGGTDVKGLDSSSPSSKKVPANPALPNPSLPPKPAITHENPPVSRADDELETAKAVADDGDDGDDGDVDESPSRNIEIDDADLHSGSQSRTNGVRSREAHSDTEEGDERPIKRLRHDSRERRQSPNPGRSRDNDELSRRSRSPSRSRSRQRQPSVGPQRSRSSSTSSRSSGLDSLEAELLGRPVKRRTSGDSETKRRPERNMPLKMKKRRQTNSAFRYVPSYFGPKAPVLTSF
jgi:hypothetical protein